MYRKLSALWLITLLIAVFPFHAVAAPFAYIANYGGNNVSVIDTATNTVAGSAIAVGSGPVGVAVNPAGSKVYVTNNSTNTVSVIDAASRTVSGTVTVGSGPWGVAINPAGTRVYVANQNDNTVSVIDTASDTVTGSTIAVGSTPQMLAVDPSGSYVYVVNSAGHTVSVISASTNSVTATIPLTGVGGRVFSLAVNPSGSKVYVADFDSQMISIIDTTSNTIVGTIPSVAYPYGIAVNPAGTRLYVTNQFSTNTLSVYDTADNSLKNTIPVGSYPAGVALNPDGTRVYVANQMSNSVSVIDASSNTLIDTVTVGSQPLSFGQFIVPKSFPVTNGLVSLWHAEGNAKDSAGSNDGTLQGGATYTYGVSGQAFSFDGSGAGVSVPASSAWAFGTGDFAISFWAYSSNFDDHRPLINNRSASASNNMWAIEIYPVANRVEFHSGLAIYLTATNLLINSSWNHIAVTRSSGTLSIYINGILSGSTSNSADFSEINELEIGRDIMSDNQLGGRGFQGRIDEVAIYNRSLSGSEIQTLYTAFARTTPDPFNFTSRVTATTGTAVESNAISVTGAAGPFPISVTTANGGQYNVSTDGGGTWVGWTNTSGNVNAGNLVKMRVTSSATPGATVSDTLTIGGISASFSVTTQFTPVSGTISSNTTWTAANSPYLLVGNLNIDAGVTLAIQPGTVVKFGYRTYMQVYGALNAPGTAGAGQIYFTSYRDDTVGGDTDGDNGAHVAAPGDWIALFVYGGGSISMDHCVVRYAGDNNSGNHAIWKQNDPGNLSITNSVISDNVGVGIQIDSNSLINTITGNTISSNSGDGVYLYNTTGTTTVSTNQFAGNDNGVHSFGSSPTISGNTFSGNNYGLYIQGATIPSAVTNNTFVSNTTGPIALDANGSGTFIDGSNNLNYKGLHIVGGTMTVDRSWSSPHTYYLTSSMDIATEKTLTIQPGTVVKLGAAGQYSYIQIYGALHANGTPDAGQIYFTSYRDDSIKGDTNGDGPSSGAPGDWIAFFVYGGGSISLDHAVVRYAGANNSGNHAIWKQNDPGNLSITNSVISDNVGAGIQIDSNSLINTITGNTISSNSGDGIYLNNATGTITVGSNQLTGNGNGLHSSNSSPTITGNTFAGNNYGLYVEGTTIPAAVTGGNAFSGNTTGPIALDANGSGALIDGTNNLNGRGLIITGGTLTVNRTWASPFAYYLTGGLTVNTSTSLTIQPGTVVKLGAGQVVQVYGTLNAPGTAGAGQIYFTSYRDDSVGGDTNGDGPSSGVAGDWIAFFVYGGGSISMDHCVVRYAGANNSGRHAIWKMNDPGTLSVTNSVISNNLGYGIEIDSNTGSNQISGNTISSNSGAGVYLTNASGTISIFRNVIRGNDAGVLCSNSSPVIGGSQAANANDIYNNSSYGVQNTTSSITVDATNNWWGSATGPAHSSNPGGTGNAVSDYVSFIPFLGSSAHTYTLNIAFAGSGGGTVTVSPSGGSGNAGWTTPIHINDGVALSATPAIDAIFGGWTGGGCGGTGACGFTMNDDTTVTATFTAVPPSTDFSGTPLSGDEPLVVNFTDLSGHGPLSWHWTFGDNGESTQENPAHVYVDAGTYQVGLTANNANGPFTATKPAFVTVNACPHDPASVLPVFYPSLQDAYDNAPGGGTIRGRYKTLAGNLNLDKGKTVYLYGGYDCPHTAVVGMTTMNGVLTIVNGTVILEGIAIK